MSFDYARGATVGERLIAKFGRDMTLKTADSGGSYNPATGTVDYGYLGEDQPTRTVKGVLIDYAQSEIDGTRIKVGDQRIYIDPTIAVTPQTGDTVEFDSKLYQVIESRPFAPGGVVVLHDVQVRGHEFRG